MIALAVIVWTFSFLEIFGNELLVSSEHSSRLSMQEYWSYVGALQWWRSIYGSVIVPIVTVLIVSGVVVLQFPRLFSFFRICIKKFPIELQWEEISESEEI